MLVSLVVLLRGANLGKRRFSPKALAESLSDLGVVNIGAAGTFVAHGKVPVKILEARVADELPWDEPEMLVLTARAVKDALETGADLDTPAGARRFATAMSKAPAKPKLPMETPGIVIDAIAGRVALGHRARVSETGVYPNEVVEKAFAVRATTRDWPTWEKIGKALDGEP